MDLPFDSSETDRKAVNPYDNYEQLNVMATPANVPGKVTSTDNRKAPQNNPSSNGPVFTGILLLVQLVISLISQIVTN